MDQTKDVAATVGCAHGQGQYGLPPPRSETFIERQNRYVEDRPSYWPPHFSLASIPPYINYMDRPVGRNQWARTCVGITSLNRLRDHQDSPVVPWSIPLRNEWHIPSSLPPSTSSKIVIATITYLQTTALTAPFIMVFKKLPGGAVYNGEWHNSQPEGYGAMTYTDGSRYEGTWHEGQRDGTGKYVCPDYEFHGTWRDNQPNGQGVKNWKTAGVYEGWFVNGLREGSGTMTWTKTGRKYTGQWRGDRMNGRGICHWPDGTWYDGEWSGMKRAGRGVAFHRYQSSGDTYEGEVLDGERHGHGKYTYADGSTYTGLYQKGLKHGAGVLVTTTHVYRGIWKENRFEGEFTVSVRATGVKSKVRYKNGKKQ